MTKSLDVGRCVAGILAGLVSITGNCVVIEPWAAALIGAIGAAIYYGFSALLKKLKIDDPLDASSASTVPAALGASSPPVYSPSKVLNDYGAEGGADDYGALYGGRRQATRQPNRRRSRHHRLGRIHRFVLFGVLKYTGRFGSSRRGRSWFGHLPPRRKRVQLRQRTRLQGLIFSKALSFFLRKTKKQYYYLFACV